MPSQSEPDTIAGQPGWQASGQGSAESILNSAMQWLGSNYDWGGSGTGGRGVDCSGLIYAAYNGGGFSIARYRAVDYGHMGTAVSQQDARPGDIVYFDNPGSDTDHVGIYLGGGKYIDSPDVGKQVRIDDLSSRPPTSIRRLLPDSAWNGMPQNSGGIYYRDANAGMLHGNPDQQVAESNSLDLADMPAYGIVDNALTLKNQQLPSAAEAQKERNQQEQSDADRNQAESNAKAEAQDAAAQSAQEQGIGDAATVGSAPDQSPDAGQAATVGDNTDLGSAGRVGGMTRPL